MILLFRLSAYLNKVYNGIDSVGAIDKRSAFGDAAYYSASFVLSLLTDPVSKFVDMSINLGDIEDCLPHSTPRIFKTSSTPGQIYEIGHAMQAWNIYAEYSTPSQQWTNPWALWFYVDGGYWVTDAQSFEIHDCIIGFKPSMGGC
jgi:hypothetical protein